MKAKRSDASRIYNTEVILPNDTNPLGYLLGGRLLYWMDIAAAISARNHAENIAVTAAVDHTAFLSPIKIGDVIYIEARPTRAFETSMEIFVVVWKQSKTGEKTKTNESYFTFVALDDDGKPTKVPPVEPANERDRELYDSAVERRKERLPYLK